jgi:hypothetical protein
MSGREGRFSRFDAVVLRRTSFGETDSVHTLLDPELGKFDAVAYGARSEKSRRGGCLIVSNRVEGLLERKDSSSPWSVKDVRLVRSYPSLVEDLHRAAWLYLVLEMLDLIVPGEITFPLYPMLLEVLSRMDSDLSVAAYALHFLVRLIQGEGLMPEDAVSADFGHITTAEGKPFLPGDGTRRFLRDASLYENASFFQGKSVSSAVENEAIAFIAGVARSHYQRELRALSLFRGISSRQ